MDYCVSSYPNGAYYVTDKQTAEEGESTDDSDDEDSAEDDDEEDAEDDGDEGVLQEGEVDGKEEGKVGERWRQQRCQRKRWATRENVESARGVARAALMGRGNSRREGSPLAPGNVKSQQKRDGPNGHLVRVLTTPKAATEMTAHNDIH